MKLSILTPSRERPTGLYKLFDSINKTISGKHHIELAIGTDVDDPTKGEYALIVSKMIAESGSNIEVFWYEQDRKPISVILNDLAKMSEADLYMIGNDDLIFKSVHWDLVLDHAVKSNPHPYFMYFFDDGIQGGNHAAFPILSKEWCHELGYYFPTIFKHNYPDTWVNDIAVTLGTRQYLSDVKIKHLHHSIWLSPFDHIYEEASHDVEADKALYNSTKADRLLCVEKLKKKILEFGKNELYLT